MGLPSPAPGIRPQGGLRPSDCPESLVVDGPHVPLALIPPSLTARPHEGKTERITAAGDGQPRARGGDVSGHNVVLLLFRSLGETGCFIFLPWDTSSAFRGPALTWGLVCSPIPSSSGPYPFPSFCDTEIHFQGSEVTACQDVLIPLNLGSSVSQGVSGGPRGRKNQLSSRIYLICRWREIPGHSQTSANGFYWATAEVFKGFFNTTLEERGWKGEYKTRFALWWSLHPGRGWAFHSVAQEGLLHADGCLALFLPWISFILFKDVRIRWRVTPAPPLPFPSCTAQKSGFLKQAQVFHQVMHP